MTKKLSLRRALCEAIVDGWQSDWRMGHAIAQAWLLAEAPYEDEAQRAKKASDLLRVPDIYYRGGIKQWTPRHMPDLNEALWAGRPRATCIAIACKSIGLNAGNAMKFYPKERDKKFDWKTVK